MAKVKGWASIKAPVNGEPKDVSIVNVYLGKTALDLADNDVYNGKATRIQCVVVHDFQRSDD